MARPKFEEQWTVPRVALDQAGHEIPDSRPLQLPAGFKRPETLAEQVARLVRSESLRRSAGEEYETFDEADDFDVDDDFDPSTPWEAFFDPNLGRDVTPSELAGTSGPSSADPEVNGRRAKAWKDRYVKRQKAFFEERDKLHDLWERGRELFSSKRQEPEKSGATRVSAEEEPSRPARGKGKAPEAD